MGKKVYQKIVVLLLVLLVVPKNEAKGLYLHLIKLETAILVLFWGDVLERFNLINKKLQSISIDLITVSNLYSSLINYVLQINYSILKAI